MLVCSKCGVLKPKSEFYKDKRSPKGYSYWCKSCCCRNTLERYYKYGGHKRIDRTIEKFVIFPRDITIWMCGLISSDGCILNPNKTKLTKHYEIKILSSIVEEDWAIHVTLILTNAGIMISKRPHHNYNSFTQQPRIWSVCLLKRNPKGKHDGINQNLSFYKSIKKWKVESFLMERKLRYLEQQLAETLKGKTLILIE